MTCRTTVGLIEVKGPGRFLGALFDWCDGTRSLTTIEELAASRWGESRFAAFVSAMLKAGVLIDASTQLERAFDDAQLPRRHGEPAPVAVYVRARLQAQPRHLRGSGSSKGSALRPTPGAVALRALTDERQSAAEFGDGELTRTQILGLLQAMYGTVPRARRGSTSTRRSVPSAGGFASLRIHVVLTRAVGSLAAGVYEAVFSARGGVALRRRAGASSEWCCALIDPHRWMRATGLVVVSTDTRPARLKYLGRALQFALIEAGAVLQNGGLAAAELGLGYRLLGGYDAARMAAVCKLAESERILCCAVFGSLAQDSRRRIRAAPPPIDLPRRGLGFRWMADEALGGRHVARAEVVAETPSGHGWGRAADAGEACAIAVSEAVERYCTRRLGDCVRARMAQLDGDVLDPRGLALYAPSQYANRVLGVNRFEPARAYFWTRAQRYESNGENSTSAWVAADFVYAATALPARLARHALFRATSSGCATDVSLAIAIERAVHEVIERDAFARHWLAQRPGVTIAPESCPVELRERVERWRGMGCNVHLGVLAASLGPVAIVGIESVAKHFAAIGTACGDAAATALGRAFDEAEVIAGVRMHADRVDRIRAADARSPSEHSLLHAQARHFRRGRILFGESDTSVSYVAIRRAWPRSLRQRLQSATGPRSTPYWVDLSAPDAPLDPMGRELKTVRVLIPGTIPLGFGQDALPRGTLAANGAAARFPHPLA